MRRFILLGLFSVQLMHASGLTWLFCPKAQKVHFKDDDNKFIAKLEKTVNKLKPNNLEDMAWFNCLCLSSRKVLTSQEYHRIFQAKAQELYPNKAT